MDPDKIKLENLSKSFEYFKVSSEIDNLENIEQVKNIAKCYYKLYLKQQEVVANLGVSNATNKITFDPDAGVAYPVNLTINTGATFKASFEVIGLANTAFNFTGYTGSSQMAKSVSIGSTSYAVATFNVGIYKCCWWKV